MYIIKTKICDQHRYVEYTWLFARRLDVLSNRKTRSRCAKINPSDENNMLLSSDFLFYSKKNIYITLISIKFLLRRKFITELKYQY